MTYHPHWAPAALLILALSGMAHAADTCECADIADLRNRETEQRAAIKAYRDALIRWAGSPPAANETSRKDFQDNHVQPELTAVTAVGTNKAKGNTDLFCKTTIEPTSVCMTEVAAQHENRHASACTAQLQANPASLRRWSTLADYALEEISAYEAEAAYVHAALVNLTTKCQLDIELTSEIAGGMEATVSNANAQVHATFTAPDHQPTTPYKGNGQLHYQTRDVGPPKKIGHSKLMKLIPACYTASTGKGTTPFNVLDGYFWRTNTPPYEPRLDLLFEIHPTSETQHQKGERGCPKGKTPQAFFSHWFVVDKTTPSAANHVLIDDWTFSPSSGAYAEKKITSTCGKPIALPGPLAAYGPLPPCKETTTFTIRLK